nr:hypothetical transcript [Hymenolepis microstoma]
MEGNNLFHGDSHRPPKDGDYGPCSMTIEHYRKKQYEQQNYNAKLLCLEDDNIADDLGIRHQTGRPIHLTAHLITKGECVQNCFQILFEEQKFSADNKGEF